MKRVIGFISIFICVLIGYYVQPILFPPETPTVKKTVVKPGTTVKPQTLKYEQIPAKGFAPFVGQTIENFEQQFGTAEKTQASGFFFETKFYMINGIYVAVNIEENKIVGINTLASGKKAQVTPFTFGMTSKKLFSTTNLSANFGVTYDEEPVAIELSENDMRYRPLIAFSNGTFAILFFDAKTEKLTAISYLDLEMLLRLMPYQITSGNPLSYRVQEFSSDWDQINTETASELQDLIRLYRKQNRYELDQTSLRSSTASQKLLKNFLQSPEKVLNKERAEQWQADQTAHLVNEDFRLKKSEFEKLAVKNKIKYQMGLFYSPVIDPFFTFFYWSSETSYNEIFSDSKPSNLGIAIDRQNVLVLKQKFEETKGSDRP